MPISLIWENASKTLVRLDISGKWGWSDMRRAIDQIADEISDQPHHCIMNYLPDVTLPIDLLAIGRRVTAAVSPNLRTVVSVIGSNIMLRTLGQAYYTFYGSRQPTVRFFSVSTLEDAYLILEREGVVADWRLRAGQNAS
jgi:hypothetical protein